MNMQDRPKTGDRRKAASELRDNVLREHRDLRELITNLGERACAPSKPPERWSDELSDILTRLRTALHQHFVDEEEGPFANELPVSFPQLAGRLEDLLAEHRDLMERLDQILRRVAEASEHATNEDVRQIRADVRVFIEAIRAHESAENALLQDSVLEDLGGGG